MPVVPGSCYAVSGALMLLANNQGAWKGLPKTLCIYMTIVWPVFPVGLLTVGIGGCLDTFVWFGPLFLIPFFLSLNLGLYLKNKNKNMRYQYDVKG